MLSTLSGLFGGAAVFVRQTNIVWIGFVVASTLLEANDGTLNISQREPKQRHESNLFTAIFQFIEYCIQSWRVILRAFWSHLMVAIIFVCFLIKNGSITVGMCTQ